MDSASIVVKGARVNNLKNISVEIPRNRLVVITGLSGSGKSSLAFDTLYAEGQRRYVESLSSYARQFLGRMPKPECDFIMGLPPAIAIEQKTNTRNSRSTVGTSTEIYDYLRMLFARVGKTISPVSGETVKRHTPDDVLKAINSHPTGTRFALLAPINPPQGRDLATHLDVLSKGGYSRIENGGRFVQIADAITGNGHLESPCNLLIDRMAVSRTAEDDSRLYDSIETAFYEGNDECIVKFWVDEGIEEMRFSRRFEADGITFQEPNDLMFNFNNPMGACQRCEGFGKVIGIDESLVVPNKALSVYADAVFCWRGEKMSEWKREFIREALKVGFPIHAPYYKLTDEQKSMLWHGVGSSTGIDGFFAFVQSKVYSIQYRVMMARYRGKTVCPDCHGSRLKPEAGWVKIGGQSITGLVSMPVSDLAAWFNNLSLSAADEKIAQRLLTEIRNRLRFLNDVGLGYLTLDRLSSTLSGGESQRINLATSLGSSLVGSLYILDEPSVGLHSRDTYRLISVLKSLRDLGNTVVVVEHDEDIIRSADYLIDIGPMAGSNGGEVVYQGDVSHLQSAPQSYTLRYLTGELSIQVPQYRRKWRNSIEIAGCAENNLKGITARFPLGVMTVVTGVSGSGKSTLVRETLYKALKRVYGESSEAPGTFSELSGDIKSISQVEMVDQSPIGKSSRSNPATYLKAFDEIRHLYAEQQLSRQMGYNASYFSYNSPGGRCEECKGEGKITIEMQFMADITLECDCCHGSRYSRDALEVLYRGKNISDILEMTIGEAIDFFSPSDGAIERKIVSRLRPLKEVGLGYVKLGQSSSTLSGGENQRVKLAYYLSGERQSPTMFIFDEPTTGLHIHDISTLIKSLNRLIDNGHTVIVIEHNMEIIKCADHIIDMGVEGGAEGGNIVATGTPEEVAQCPDSITARYLKKKLRIT